MSSDGPDRVVAFTHDCVGVIRKDNKEKKEEGVHPLTLMVGFWLTRDATKDMGKCELSSSCKCMPPPVSEH